MTTYPDYQSLPREVKKFLLASENYFFQEANGHHAPHAAPTTVAVWETAVPTQKPHPLVVLAR